MSPDEKVRKFTNPDHVALGCDAFWNSFWNLNLFWNLVTPEWTSKWVNSQLAMYDSNGWLAKGPAGMEYIPVMVAEHEIPLIVSAYQMGIRDYDVEKAFEAIKKCKLRLLPVLPADLPVTVICCLTLNINMYPSKRDVSPIQWSTHMMTGR